MKCLSNSCRLFSLMELLLSELRLIPSNAAVHFSYIPVDLRRKDLEMTAFFVVFEVKIRRRSVIAEGSRRVLRMMTLSVFILTLFDRSIDRRRHSMQQADQFSWLFIFACEQNEKWCHMLAGRKTVFFNTDYLCSFERWKVEYTRWCKALHRLPRGQKNILLTYVNRHLRFVCFPYSEQLNPRWRVRFVLLDVLTVDE